MAAFTDVAPAAVETSVSGGAAARIGPGVHAVCRCHAGAGDEVFGHITLALGIAAGRNIGDPKIGPPFQSSLTKRRPIADFAVNGGALTGRTGGASCRPPGDSQAKADDSIGRFG
ncbi:hypothetical protein ACVDG5_005220 [Mesorhizobium sp. ORM6]